MTITQMKEKKAELGLTNEIIARQSGIPLSTVQKIFCGVTKTPRKNTLDAIRKVLLQTEQDMNRPSQYARAASAASLLKEPSSGLFGQSADRAADMMKEAALSYNTAPKADFYTIEDYYALPDDQRVELIDGVFYDMGAPSMTHQFILGELYVLFRICAEQHDMPCDVYLSPCDVRLDRDIYTMVQPDLLVICGEYDGRAIRYEGAPDLVVEILSPSTRMKDMVLKLYKYQRAGVREYWIIDPKNRKVTVHYFEEEEYSPKTYSFDDKIPVGISGGLCSINFSAIRQRMDQRGM